MLIIQYVAKCVFVVYVSGGQLLVRHNLASTVEEGAVIVGKKLDDGSALHKFKQMIVAQGVDREDAENLCNDNGEVLPNASYVTIIQAKESGK